MHSDETFRAGKILSALREIRQSRHLNLVNFSRAIVSQLKAVTDCSGCAVILIDGGRAKMIAQKGISDDALGIELRIDTGALGALRENQKSIQESDLEEGVLSALVPADRGAQSVVCTPIIHEDVVVSIIYFDSQTKDAFLEEELFFAELMAAELSLAIQRTLVEARVKELSKMDGVTGCLSRQSMEEDIRLEIARANRYEKKFSFCLLEIGGLEGPQCCLGKEEKIEVLNTVVTAFRRNIRNIDRIYRVEKNRFTILLPETDKIEAITVASRLLEMIDQTPCGRDDDQSPRKMTITIGITGYPGDGNSVTELLNSASTALRQAAAKGSNKLWVSGEGEPALEPTEMKS